MDGKKGTPEWKPEWTDVHSLQREGEVMLAGLAVPYQVAALLAQPQ